MTLGGQGFRRWGGASLGPIALLILIASGSQGDGPPSEAEALATRGRPASIREPLPGQEKVAKKKEHCSADADLLRSIGRARGEQVRIYRDDSEFAVFTIADVPDEAPDSIVRMGKFARLRFGPSEEFEGRIVPTVTASHLTDEQARDRGELVERLVDDGKNTGLLIMAPHGGQLETPTDLQAERLAEKLGQARASTWICKGFHPRGGKAAFDRWHITSTDISEASYPMLARVAARKFEYAISFHGMAEDRILIGGTAPTRLRQEIREAIRLAIDDPKMAVDLSLPGEPNGGLDPKNIVNRYASQGGVQIEQSPRARREHWKEIVDAVARVFAAKL